MPLFLLALKLSTTVRTTDSNDIPLSLYVHIPWCVKKCPYCDFNSHEKNETFDEKRYISALLLDLDEEYQRCQNRDLSSIFFGGGTPSLFSADALFQVIDHAKKLFRFDNIEITMEANPGTFEQEKFNAFHDAGINRLSIGIQSFNRAHLKSLGRIHDDQQALKAVETARLAGFDNINLDLMFGLPAQSIQQAVNDVTTACEFDASHISHYQLTIEENTFFHKHTPVLPETDTLWEMQTNCQQILRDRGYRQYEISAYSKADKRCLHNMNYWHFGDYIGIGAGAHGKISEREKTTNTLLTIRRRWKHRQPQQYMQQTLSGSALSGENRLIETDIVFEFLLNALRLKQGCDLQTYIRHSGLDIKPLEQMIKDIDPTLLTISEGKICTSDKGFLFLNEILEQLV